MKTNVKTIQTIEPKGLLKKLNSNEHFILIYTLDKEAYKAKHIPGSINIPIEDIDIVENIIPDKNEEIIVYCANSDCKSSRKAVKKMIEMGYTNVIDFEKGLAGWRLAGYKLTGEG